MKWTSPYQAGSTKRMCFGYNSTLMCKVQKQCNCYKLVPVNTVYITRCLLLSCLYIFHPSVSVPSTDTRSSEPDNGLSCTSVTSRLCSQIRAQAFSTVALQVDSSAHSSCFYCVSMRAAILQATAEIRAAPRPLPSSDWMKVISQWGVRSRTILWNLSRKLRERNKRFSVYNQSHLLCHFLFLPLWTSSCLIAPMNWTLWVP